MSQKDNFGSGFVIGSLIGGLVGGLLGTLLATRNDSSPPQQARSLEEGEPPIKFTSEESIEIARHSLEDKIAQLNLAIDEVREQLDSVNSNSAKEDRLN